MVADPTERDRCSCYYVSEHFGAEADAYVRDHLEEVRVDSEWWTIEYRCPLYSKRWLLDQPLGEMHGGGPHRLRTLEEVRADLRRSLTTVASLLPNDEEAPDAAKLLMEKTGDSDQFRFP